MRTLTALGEVQIPLLAAVLLGACAAKAARAARLGSISAALGPTALFPLRLRRSAAIALCAVEFAFGIGLILTAGTSGAGRPADLVRLGTFLLFVVATCTLIELRNARPDIGCGCFGEFSTAPVTGRTLARAALLAAAAFGSIGVRSVRLPHTAADDARILLLLVAELAVLGLLSPELREVMVGIGYTAPCELRVASPEQTLAALQRSPQWRRHSGLIASPEPADMWRELCWRYVAFSSRQAGREAELVFAVYLQSYRPTVLSVLVDTATGETLPWPAGAAGSVPSWRRKASSLLGPATLRLARLARAPAVARLLDAVRPSRLAHRSAATLASGDDPRVPTEPAAR